MYLREERKCPEYWNDYKGNKLSSKLLEQVELCMREAYTIKIIQDRRIALDKAEEAINNIHKDKFECSSDYIDQRIHSGYEIDTFLLLPKTVRKRILSVDSMLGRGLSVASAFEIIRQRNSSSYFNYYSSCEQEKQRRYTIRYIVREMDGYGCIEVDGEIIRLKLKELAMYVEDKRDDIAKDVLKELRHIYEIVI